MMMTQLLTGLALGVMLLGPTPAPAETVGAPPAALGTPVSGDQPIVLAEEAAPVSEILHMEPEHLLVLGVGLVAGALVIAPYLGLSELLGVAVGVISGEVLYRGVVLPFEGRSSWFN